MLQRNQIDIFNVNRANGMSSVGSIGRFWMKHTAHWQSMNKLRVQPSNDDVGGTIDQETVG